MIYLFNMKYPRFRNARFFISLQHHPIRSSIKLHLSRRYNRERGRLALMLPLGSDPRYYCSLLVRTNKPITPMSMYFSMG